MPSMRSLGKAVLIIFLAGIGLLDAGGSDAPATPAPKRILILYDEDKDGLPGLARVDRSLREAFRSRLAGGVEITSESLALLRFEQSGYDALLADFYRRKYAGSPPDLIIAVLEPSLDFLLRHADTLFHGVPIVFSGVDATTLKEKTLPRNVTGVLVKRTFSGTLEDALRLQPQTRNIFVVGGTSSFDRYLQGLVRRDLEPLAGRVEITYLFGESMDALQARLAKLPDRSAILYITVLRRWKIDETRLPPGSVVQYREPSAWDLYRWQIITTIAVVLTQAALIAGLVLARTRQRRAETEARQQRDDLAHVLRVTTLGELTSSLAHEVSQPLTSITMNAQAAERVLEDGQANASDLREMIVDIKAGAEHASHVLERVRTLFRKEPARSVAVEVAPLIEDVVRLLRAAMLVERIDIRLRFEQGVPAVFGDPVQLEQVLLNVVRNACDAVGASKDGPRVVTIETRRSDPGHVTIEVSDTGVGFAGGELERIFEHFVSTKPRGLGMGLAISRSIIKSHGGLIWATRNADQGLTIHIELVAWTFGP